MMVHVKPEVTIKGKEGIVTDALNLFAVLT